MKRWWLLTWLAERDNEASVVVNMASECEDKELLVAKMASRV